MDIDKREVGNRIRSIRLALGMTTEDFAKSFTPPASKGTVSKWENGHYLPNNKRLVTIAELKGITVDELLHGDKSRVSKKELGEKITLIRVNRKETLEEFANKMQEVTNRMILPNKSAVSKWEKGENYPGITALNAIAQLGNTTVEVLLYGNSRKIKVMNDFIKYLEEEIKWRKESIIGFENAFVEGSRSEAIRYAKEYIERKLGGTHEAK